MAAAAAAADLGLASQLSQLQGGRRQEMQGRSLPSGVRVRPSRERGRRCHVRPDVRQVGMDASRGFRRRRLEETGSRGTFCWIRLQWNGIKLNGMEWNGMEWNGMD